MGFHIRFCFSGGGSSMCKHALTRGAWKILTFPTSETASGGSYAL